jgi:hypothetical protein
LRVAFNRQCDRKRRGKLHMNSGNCPKCAQLLTNVKVERIDVSEGLTKRWKGVSFVCPYCYAILSVGLDPVALTADLVDEILKKLDHKR